MQTYDEYCAQRGYIPFNEYVSRHALELTVDALVEETAIELGRSSGLNAADINKAVAEKF